MSKQAALRALVVMLGVVSFSLIASPSAMAQETRAGSELNENLYFDLDFPGGTLGQYLDAIRKAHLGANVFLSNEETTARIPAMKLSGVTLGAATKLVQGNAINAAGDTVNIWWNPVDIAGRIEKAYRIGVTSPTIKASVQGDGAHSADQQIRNGRSNVWSLRGLVDAGLKMDDVLGAVRVALKTIGKPTEIQFHEPTSLLIVRGTKEQLELVDQAVSAMIDNSRNQAANATWIAGQLDSLQGELVRAEVERRVAEKRLEIDSELSKRSQQNLEKEMPNLTDDQVAGFERMHWGLELDVIQAEGKLEIAQDKVDRLSKRIGRFNLLSRGSE